MIKLLDNRVLLQPIEEDAVSAGGILLPGQKTASSYRKATVAGVGPGRTLDNGKLVKLQVKIGDTVLLSSDVGFEVKINGEALIVVVEEDLLAILD